MKPLLLIVLLLLANTVAAAELIAGKEYSREEFDAMKKAAESQGMAPSGDTTTKRKYTTEELDAMQDAVQSRNAAEKQRARLAKDNYACLLEYRTSAPAIQAPLGSSGEAVIMQGMIERKREEKYVQACLESKGWTLPARNAESTK